MSFEPHNCCITGGAGFIGANFVRHWLAQDQRGQRGRPRCADLCRQPRESRRSGARSPLSCSCAATSATRRAVRALLEQHRIDTIVHFAAESHVDRSILGPDDFIRTNVVGTHRCSRRRRRCGSIAKIVPAHRFHHVSTDEVYGSLEPERSAVPRSDSVRAELARIPPARPPRIIWCAPITRPTDSTPRSPTARTTMGLISFPRS